MHPGLAPNSNASQLPRPRDSRSLKVSPLSISVVQNHLQCPYIYMGVEAPASILCLRSSRCDIHAHMPHQPYEQPCPQELERLAALLRGARILPLTHQSSDGQHGSGPRRPGTPDCTLSTIGIASPHRVWVLLARDTDLLSQALGVFVRKLFAWQRRGARAHHSMRRYSSAMHHCPRRPSSGRQHDAAGQFGCGSPRRPASGGRWRWWPVFTGRQSPAVATNLQLSMSDLHSG